MSKVSELDNIKASLKIPKGVFGESLHSPDEGNAVLKKLMQNSTAMMVDVIKGRSSQGATANARAELETAHMRDLQGTIVVQRVSRESERYALQASAAA